MPRCAGHRKSLPTGHRRGSEDPPVSRTGGVVAQRSLEFSNAVAQHLARGDPRMSAALELTPTILERFRS